MDRISRLPDEILQHILSFLPTKYAVATSILSSRWTDLWLFLPVLDFDDSLYLHPQKNRYRSTNARRKNLFMEFVDVVLSLNHSPNLSRFRLCINVESQVDLSDTNEWIRTILQRNVVELHLSVTCRFTDGVYNLRIPPSKSLQALKICSYCGLHMPTSGEFFPNLRTFEFEGPFEDIEDELPIKFFTTLPRLEKLSISGEISSNMGSLSLNIVGPSLKSLIVNICKECEPRYADMHLLEYERDHCYVTILIDAPHLEFLHLRDEFFVSYSIKNLATNCKVKLDVNLVDVGEMITYSFEEYQSEICMPMNAYYPNESSIQLMEEICNVECLSISASITRALMNAIDKNLPTFHHLTKLELTLHRRGWNLFLHWLHNSPNLQFLVLNNQDYDEEISTEDEWSFIDCVPACLLLHLKEVEIKRLGKQQEDKVLTYLRTNARVLQKITLNSHLVSI